MKNWKKKLILVVFYAGTVLPGYFYIEYKQAKLEELEKQVEINSNRTELLMAGVEYILMALDSLDNKINRYHGLKLTATEEKEWDL
tara:strand:+ start:468 stop:725 length:258 start_codon:yes stop_codon:yes gene_type:complete